MTVIIEHVFYCHSPPKERDLEEGRDFVYVMGALCPKHLEQCLVCAPCT